MTRDICPLCVVDEGASSSSRLEAASTTTSGRVLLQSTAVSGNLEHLQLCPRCNSEFGIHNQSWLTPDDELRAFLDLVVGNLQIYFRYSFADACELVEDFYRGLGDPTFCAKFGVPVLDEEALWHAGPLGVALLVHYHLSLKAEPSEFLRWRTHWQLRLSK